MERECVYNLPHNGRIKEGNELLHLGHPKVTDEQRVTAMGVYHRVKRVDRNTFYNEIEAKDIR